MKRATYNQSAAKLARRGMVLRRREQMLLETLPPGDRWKTRDAADAWCVAADTARNNFVELRDAGYVVWHPWDGGYWRRK